SSDLNGSIDERATPVGYEANGAGLYACVGDFNNGRHPGKIRPGFDGCNIGYGGKEYAAKTYSVLISGGNWVPMNQGAIPWNAPAVGQEADGRPLYFCRAMSNGSLAPGKIGPSTGSCNIGYGGNEYTIYSYDVFVP
ncbi:MAG: DUF3421 domain-containing protein, partial [Zavarzinia sp.]|nr:DUF3421 domain-containing protein [Zavarzinia sp.]